MPLATNKKEKLSPHCPVSLLCADSSVGISVHVGSCQK